jgi:hypothetical protein
MSTSAVGATRSDMNWKAILGLSMFGLAMGLGTVFAISPRVEAFFWLVIFVVCAFVIVRQSPSRPFLHGFLLGIVNSVWVTGAHIAFFQRYLAHHPSEAAMMSRMPASMSPRMVMALTGPIIGVISGVAIGVLAYVVAKALRLGEQKPSSKARRARAGS